MPQRRVMPGNYRVRINTRLGLYQPGDLFVVHAQNLLFYVVIRVGCSTHFELLDISLDGTVS